MATYTTNPAWLRHWNSGRADGAGPVYAVATRLRLFMLKTEVRIKRGRVCVLPVRPFVQVTASKKEPYTKRQAVSRVTRFGSFHRRYAGWRTHAVALQSTSPD